MPTKMKYSYYRDWSRLELIPRFPIQKEEASEMFLSGKHFFVVCNYKSVDIAFIGVRGDWNLMLSFISENGQETSTFQYQKASEAKSDMILVKFNNFEYKNNTRVGAYLYSPTACNDDWEVLDTPEIKYSKLDHLNTITRIEPRGRLDNDILWEKHCDFEEWEGFVLSNKKNTST